LFEKQIFKQKESAQSAIEGQALDGTDSARFFEQWENRVKNKGVVSRKSLNASQNTISSVATND
jgi:hypothetical protein